MALGGIWNLPNNSWPLLSNDALSMSRPWLPLKKIAGNFQMSFQRPRCRMRELKESLAFNCRRKRGHMKIYTGGSLPTRRIWMMQMLIRIRWIKSCYIWMGRWGLEKTIVKVGSRIDCIEGRGVSFTPTIGVRWECQESGLWVRLWGWCGPVASSSSGSSLN